MRRRSFVLPVIMLCVVLLIIAGGSAYFLVARQRERAVAGSLSKQSETVVTDFFSLVGDGQYEALYGLISAGSRDTIAEDAFVTKYRNIYSGIGAENIVTVIEDVTDYEVYIGSDSKGDEPEVTKKRVQFTQSMDTVAGEITITNYAVVSLNEEEEYRIEWTPQVIFPTLSWTDKVRVNKLTGQRGSIYDRNHNLLAGAGVASSVGFVPGKMNRDEASGDFLESDLLKVAELLEQTPESISKKLNASYVKDDTFVHLRNVSKEAYDVKEELLKVPGIKITDTTIRHYPLGEKASHLVGYIQNINAEELERLKDQGYNQNSVIGKAGLESIYEEQLRGSDGCEILITDDQGNPKETLAIIEKIDGRDLTLTIDSAVQNRLYELFTEDKSASVAIDPKTGEVLALVSTPTYDANDFVLGMSGAKWAELNEDANQPLYNRFKAALCPGSTFKAVTAAVGVNTGKISPTQDFGHSGLRWRKDESWGGYYITTTKEYNEPANVENALVYSDNIYFAKAALQIEADLFAGELVKLGFEERIPFEYGLYSSTISSTETFTSEVQLADSGFGQGQILTNPLHLACIYSAFVNEGNMIQPYLLFDANRTPGYWKEQAFSPETARTIRDSLIQVVERGTATDARIAGRRLGGKTGTAEIKQSKDDQSGTELGWFVQFTADENEENPLLVISMVEDVKGRGGSHYVSQRVKTVFE